MKHLTGIKDIDVKILNYLSDFSLINTMTTCKYIRCLTEDENFWMNRAIFRFPELSHQEHIEYKNEYNENWKTYYIENLSCFEKVLDNDIIENILYGSCENGKMASFLILIAKNLNNFENSLTKSSIDPLDICSKNCKPLFLACKGGNVEILDMIISLGCECDVYSGFVEAIRCGNLSIIKYMFEYCNVDGLISVGIYYSCARGHLEIVKYFLAKDNIDDYGYVYSRGLRIAMKKGRSNVVDFLMENGVKYEKRRIML